MARRRVRAFGALLLWLALLPGVLRAEERLLIATAANFKPAMQELIAQFKTARPDAEVEASFGSSGKLSAQIREGAPFDLFFSADMEFPQALAQSGHAATPARVYARGRLVLWSASMDARTVKPADLTDARFAKIAIANPRTAPYGARAEEALRASGLWEKVEGKLVFGENIAQTAQFVQSGNAQIGFIALSQALDPELAQRGAYARIDAALHSPLDQGYVITRHGADKPLARAFAALLDTAPARAIVERHGYALPASP